MRKMWGIFILTLILLTKLPLLVDAYTYSGTIYEDHDQYWDDNEINFFRFDLYRGETLEVALSSSGNLELMLCICTNYEDIEDIAESMRSSGASNRLFLWIDSYTVNTGSYTSNANKTTHLAIFTAMSNNPSSMSYTVNTNIKAGARFTQSGTDKNSEDPGNFGYYLFALIAFFVIRDYYIKRKRDPKSGLEGELMKICDNCGNSTRKTYCTNCGVIV